MKGNDGECAVPHGGSEVALDDLPTNQVETVVTNMFAEHRNQRIVMGRLLAELHRRDPKANSYTQLAARTGIPLATLWRWAKPFTEEGDQ